MRFFKKTARRISSFWIRDHTLQWKIVVSQVAFAMVPLLILTAFMTVTISENEFREKREAASSSLNVCVQSIDRMYAAYLSESVALPNNDYIYRDISGVLDGDMSQLIELQIIMPSMMNELNSNQYLTSNIIFYLEGYRYSPSVYCASLNDFPERGKKAAVLADSYNDVIWSNVLFTDTSGNRFLCFYRNLTSLFGKNVIMQVNIPLASIERYMNGIALDSRGTVMSLRDPVGGIRYLRNAEGAVSPAGFEAGRYYFISADPLRDGSGLSIGLPKRQIWENRIVSVGFAVLFCLTFSALVLLMSNIATRRITHSLAEFVDSLRDNEQSLLSGAKFHIKLNEEDEIDIIKNKFVRLLMRMNDTYQDLMNIHRQKSLLELTLLQSNVNPHLLYNSLSAIRMSAVRNHDSMTMQIVDALSRYYRSALSNGENIIPVASEIQFIRDYLDIMRLTYRQVYRLEVDIPEELQKHRILRHLLQPVVENSVKHAFGSSESEKTISISGRWEGKTIYFVVKDNGCGMEPSLVQKIVSMEYKAQRGGYGIRNVIQRIQLFYGKESGLSIKSSPGAGTSVKIKICEGMETPPC